MKLRYLTPDENSRIISTGALRPASLSLPVSLPDSKPDVTLIVEAELTSNASTHKEISREEVEKHKVETNKIGALLANETQNQKRSEYGLIITILSYVAVWLIAISTRTEGFGSQTYIEMTLAWFFGLTAILSIFGFFSHLVSQKRRKSALDELLIRSDQIGRANELLQMLNIDHTPTQNYAKLALIEVLPSLQASDTELISDTHRTILMRMLASAPNNRGQYVLTEVFSQSAYRREVDIRVAILKALEQVGSAKELPLVELLAHGGRMAPSGLKVLPEIQTAAQACLPYLLVRAQLQNGREQLLRASVDRRA